MNDQNINTEQILYKIGGKHKYQIIITIIFLFLSYGADATLSMLSLETSQPFIDIIKEEGGEKITLALTYEICEEYKGIVNINYDYSILNWALRYDFYCSKLKNTIITTAFVVGMFFGLLSMIYLKRFAKEKTIKIVQLIYCLSFTLIAFNAYEAVVAMNLIQGYCQVSTLVLKNSIMAEIVDKDSRSTYQIILSSYIFMLAVSVPFIYKSGFDWRLIYMAIGIVQLISVILIWYFLEVNPRFYILHGDIDKAIETSIKIAKFNNILKPDDGLKPCISNNSKDDKLTEEELKQWIRDTYTKKSEINLVETQNTNTNSQIEIDTFIESQDPKSTEGLQENMLIPLQTPSTEPSVWAFKLNYVFLLIVLCFFTMFYFTNLYEIKKFSNQKNFALATSITTVFIILLYIMNTFLMKSKIGRKGTIIFNIGLAILSRTLTLIIFNETNFYFYLSMFAIVNTSISCVHITISESFSNKTRLTIYSLIYLIAKLLVIAIPSVVEYTSQIVLGIIYIVIGCVVIIAVIFIKETNGKELED